MNNNEKFTIRTYKGLAIAIILAIIYLGVELPSTALAQKLKYQSYEQFYFKSFHLNQASGNQQKKYKYHAGEGLIIGIIGGGLVGGVIGLASYKECDEQGLFACIGQPTSPGESFGLSAVIGGAIGGVLGLLIGSSIKTERRPHQAVNVSIMPSANTRKLTFSPTLKVRLPIGRHHR
ncbi:MAG TPA: hypothetical protein VJ964_04810 [Balneolaceae bacterium]|nr:hypothetical protein [Balneolaceae bacterium]